MAAWSLERTMRLLVVMETFSRFPAVRRLDRALQSRDAAQVSFASVLQVSWIKPPLLIDRFFAYNPQQHHADISCHCRVLEVFQPTSTGKDTTMAEQKAIALEIARTYFEGMTAGQKARPDRPEAIQPQRRMAFTAAL